MLAEAEIKQLREETELQIRYTVAAPEQEEATTLLQRYASDPYGLPLLHFYYSSLPEPHDQAVHRIGLVASHEDVFLFVLSCAGRHDLCLADSQRRIVWLGEFEGGLAEPELLDYFGFVDQPDFQRRFPEPAACPEYQPLLDGVAPRCPVCLVAEGEFHRLGCPVELCPWCDGQLSHCACRFDQLGVEEIEHEEQLAELAERLTQKGRIPFQKEHAPSFPVAGE